MHNLHRNVGMFVNGELFIFSSDRQITFATQNSFRTRRKEVYWKYVYTGEPYVIGQWVYIQYVYMPV